MGPSEEGTGRVMDGVREEANRRGIARGKEGARDQGNETSRRYPEYTVLFTPHPATRCCH